MYNYDGGTKLKDARNQQIFPYTKAEYVEGLEDYIGGSIAPPEDAAENFVPITTEDGSVEWVELQAKNVSVSNEIFTSNNLESVLIQISEEVKALQENAGTDTPGEVQPSSSRGIISLYHMEETDGILVDSVGNTSILQGTGWESIDVSKFGSSSIFKYSVGHIELSGLSALDSFTIEWWQYDTGNNGYGGIILEDAYGQTLEMVPVSSTSPIYGSRVWKHIAISHKHDGLVSIYIDGKLVGFSEVDTPLQGNIKFFGLRSYGADNKDCYIDELAIFNYNRYTSNFNVPVNPYAGSEEVPIGVCSDIVIEGAIGDTVDIDIPISLPAEDIDIEYDTSELDQTISELSISGNNLTGTLLDDTPREYSIIARHPGSVSVPIPVKINTGRDRGYVIYCGYFTSDTIQSVKGITASELTQNTIKSLDVVGADIYIEDIPAGAFTVVLIPESAGLAARKSRCGCYTDSPSFNPDIGSTDTGSNGDVVTIGNTVYKVYGEFNVRSVEAYIQVYRTV